MPAERGKPKPKKEVVLTNAEKHVVLKGDLDMRRIRTEAARQAAKKPPAKDDS